MTVLAWRCRRCGWRDTDQSKRASVLPYYCPRCNMNSLDWIPEDRFNGGSRWVEVTDELLAQLGEWSPTVQVRVTEDADGILQMEFRREER